MAGIMFNQKLRVCTNFWRDFLHSIDFFVIQLFEHLAASSKKMARNTSMECAAANAQRVSRDYRFYFTLRRAICFVKARTVLRVMRVKDVKTPHPTDQQP